MTVTEYHYDGFFSLYFDSELIPGLDTANNLSLRNGIESATTRFFDARPPNP